MKIKIFFKYLPIIISIPVIIACKKNRKSNIVIQTNSETKIVNGNQTTITSNNISELGKWLDFKTFKPHKVKFQTWEINNEEGRVPGPSDSRLEAVLYFDDITMGNIKKFLEKNETIPLQNGQNFKFNWLDKDIQEELKSVDFKLNIYGDTVFRSGGYILTLKDKILVYHFTT